MQQPTSSVQEEIIWDDSMMEVDDFPQGPVVAQTQLAEVVSQEDQTVPAGSCSTVSGD